MKALAVGHRVPVSRFHAHINDVLRVMALPERWLSDDPETVVSTLLEGALGMLRLEFSCLRINSPFDGIRAETLQLCGGADPALERQLSRALDGWLAVPNPGSRRRVPNPFGPGHVTLACLRLGIREALGTLVVGARRAAFPTRAESVLLQVAVNQVVIGLDEVRRCAEREYDIAERARTEREHLQLASVVENRGTFIGLPSPARLCWFISIADQKLVGLCSDDQLHQTTIADYVATDEQWTVDRQVLPALARSGSFDGEICFRHFATGAKVPMLAHIFPMAEPGFPMAEPGTTQPIGPAAIGRAISGRQEEEAQLYASKEKLSGDVAANIRLNEFSARQFSDRALPPTLSSMSSTTTASQNDDEVRLYHTASCALQALASERERTQGALRRSEFQLAEAQRISHTGSWVWNLVTNDVLWSDELCRILGFAAGSVTPTYDLFWETLHFEDRAFIRQRIDRAVVERRHFDEHFRLARLDGSVRHVHAVGHPMFSDAGELVEYMGTIIDITERKLAEDVVRRAEQDLARVGRSMTMGKFTAAITHEMSQPLAAVVVSADACVRWLSANPPNLAEVDASVRRIARDAHRASEVVTCIRSLLTRGKPQKAALSARDVLLDVISLIQGKARAGGVRVFMSAPNELPRFSGDRIQLQQVLLNLALNAIEAMRSVTGRPRRLHIGVAQHGNAELRFDVCDSGPGLDSTQRHRVFDAFFTTKEQGMGMGLAICRSIIHAHGGKLWVNRNAGPGVTFQFTLPCSTSDPRQASRAALASASTERRIRRAERQARASSELKTSPMRMR